MEGTTITLDNLSFTDLNAPDLHTAIIDWGDGNTTAGTVDQGAGTITGTHVFNGLSTKSVTVTLTDGDGTGATAVVSIGVTPAAVPVPGLTTWGLGLGAAALAAVYLVYWRRRRAAG